MALSKARDPRGTQLYTSLRSSISTGKLKPGECLPGLRKLQEEFGISYSATRAALARLEKEGLVVSQSGSGTYVAEEPGKTEVNGTTIGVVVSYSSHFSELFLKPLLDAVRGELEELGCTYSVNILRREGTWNDEEWMMRTQEEVEAVEADAALHVCPSLDLRAPPPTRPAVLVAQDLEIAWPKACGYDLVSIDSRQSGAAAARHLKEVGCKRVATLGVRYEEEGIQEVSPYCRQRLWGFREGWGAPVPEPMMFFCARHTPIGGATITPQILALDPLPDAVFATTDDLAYGLCHVLVAHGIQPGKDIKVIGCDGQPPLYPQDPILTSIAAPLEKMGVAAARMALQRAKNSDDTAHRELLSCTVRKGDTA